MTIYYVDNTRPDDSGDGLSQATAKKTINAGIALVNAGSGSDNLRIVETGTDYTITASLTVITGSKGGANWHTTPTLIEGWGGSGARPTIRTSTNSVNFWGVDSPSGSNFFTFRHFNCINTATTKGSGIVLSGTGAGSPSVLAQDCEFNGCSLTDGNRGTFRLDRTVIRNCSGTGLTQTKGAGWLTECKFIDNGSHGAAIGPFLTGGIFERCVFSGNTGSGFILNPTSTSTGLWYRFSQCTFEGNGARGLYLPVGAGGTIQLDLLANIFWGNTGGFGVEVGANAPVSGYLNLYNAYGGNSSGDHSGWFDGYNKKSLSVNPFTNSASEDWSPNSTAGGGLLLRGLGAGGADIGAIQSSGGGSTGPPLNLGMTGGMTA
jgi:hypothetical protein